MQKDELIALRNVFPSKQFKQKDRSNKKKNQINSKYKSYVQQGSSSSVQDFLKVVPS